VVAVADVLVEVQLVLVARVARAEGVEKMRPLALVALQVKVTQGVVAIESALITHLAVAAAQELLA